MPAPAQTQAPNTSGGSPVLREAAKSGTLAGLKWPRFPYYRDELTALYSSRDWQPVWTSNGRPTAAARGAVDVLLSAQDRGLHPDDYDAGKLDEQYKKLSAGTATAGDIGWFDAALSIGLFRHVSDLRIGRVNPRNLSVGINTEPKKLDLAREVSGAIASGRIADLVRRSEPPFRQYTALKAAYTRYRTLAGDSALPTVTISRTVRPGESFDQTTQLRRRLAAFGDLPAASARTAGSTYDRVTAAAVAHFQYRHGLTADSTLGKGTVAAINVSPATRLRQLELALERIRWLPDLSGGPFVVANVPSFELYAFDSIGGPGKPTVQMNIVVGKANVGRRTPLFEDHMDYIIFRPYWVIPPGILANETLPAVRRGGSGYLERNNMELYSGDGNSPSTGLATTSSNLARAGSGVGIRQKPGPRNALGLAKFIFPNDHNVYFHGTPAQDLFSRSRRDFSHGCVRLEDPAEFATWVLHDSKSWSRKQVEEAMNGEPSRKVNLPSPLPVVIYYTTAVVRPDGSVGFFDDVYGHDAALQRALEKGYPYKP
ncbi:MAG: murein L,D-transpeptidase [Gemmatimonadaceae bacterium]|jgi:murein L,D-transpeptidase YcbB/YkuD